jgi:preprotein translocase subunit SecB
MTQKTKKSNFILHSIYTKDISFESPKTPQIFNLKLHPNLDFDLQTKINEVEKDVLYEVILKISVIIYSVKEKEKKIEKDQTAFLIEIQQAGLFYISGFDENKKRHILSTDCPSTLFPYAREVISNIVIKGGFPQIILPPINFSMINKINNKSKDIKE